MAFDTFLSSSRVNCVIPLNFNLDAVHEKRYVVTMLTISVRVNYTLAKFNVTWIKVNTMLIHSRVNRALIVKLLPR